jgi:hypothetical protein
MFIIQIILSFICAGAICCYCDSNVTTDAYSVSNLSNNNSYSINQQLLQTKEMTYVVWAGSSNSTSGAGNILFRSSNDSANHFNDILILSNKTGDSNLPSISSSGNNVYIAWEEKSPQNSHINFRYSTDNGATFSDIVDVSNGTIGSTLAKVVSNKNYVYVVWVGSNFDNQKNFEVFVRRSNDSGQSFGNVINMSKSEGDSIDPQIIVPINGSMIYVVYTDCDPKHADPLCRIYLVRSSNNGLTFNSPLLISTEPVDDPYNPSANNFESRIGEPLPSTHEPNVQNRTREHNSVIPLVTSSADGKAVYVFWEDDLTRTGSSDIFFKRSMDFGKTFEAAINLSNTPGISRLARSITLGSDIYLVWSDTNTTIGQFDVFFKKLGEYGKQLGKTINLSNSNRSSAPSDIGLYNNSKKIHVAWIEQFENGSKILLATSTNSGNTFGKPIAMETKVSSNPSLIHISYSNNSGLAWTEYSKENANIYFTRID